VLISAFAGTQQLSDAAFAVLDDPEREFVITDFLKLELLPKAIFHKKNTEANFYNTFFEQACYVVEITSELTTGALALACLYNLSAIDSIHVHSALVSSSTEFITTEKPTKPFFQITDTSLKIISLASMEDT
jgi:predicted nucleic acid-binding protein